MDSFKWYQRYFLSRYKFFLFNVWKLPINQVGDLSIAIRSMIDGIPIRLHRGFDRLTPMRRSIATQSR
jgi:hypothetical protein